MLDDRQKSAGVKFADSDLIGAPIRIVVSKRNIADNLLEIKTIDDEQNQMIDVNDVIKFVQEKMKGWKK